MRVQSSIDSHSLAKYVNHENKIPATETSTRVSVALEPPVEHPFFHKTRATWIITHLRRFASTENGVSVCGKVAVDEEDGKDEHSMWNRFQLENCCACLTACNSMWKMSQTRMDEPSTTCRGQSNNDSVDNVWHFLWKSLCIRSLSSSCIIILLIRNLAVSFIQLLFIVCAVDFFSRLRWERKKNSRIYEGSFFQHRHSTILVVEFMCICLIDDAFFNCNWWLANFAFKATEHYCNDDV